MKRGLSLVAIVAFGFSAAGRCAQQAVHSANAKSSAKNPMEQMRLTTKSDHARELFGQAIVLSGNYRLDECLKSLRAAVGEDPDFAAGWSLLAYYATDSHEAADALAHAQNLVGKASPSEMLFVRWVGALGKA